MRRLKCVDCLLWFMESEIRGDAFLCPQCGGRLEELSDNTGSHRSAGHEGTSAKSKQQARSDKIRTHYDNLKVARDAPDEVIRAAYRSLSQKYHPDKNQSPDAVRVMRIINADYETLSDPQKRHEHDLWIARAETTWQKAQRESFNTSSNRQDEPAETSRPTSGVTVTIPKPSLSAFGTVAYRYNDPAYPQKRQFDSLFSFLVGPNKKKATKQTHQGNVSGFSLFMSTGEG